jgi:Secretion system C-terminal sorting domain
MKRILNLVICVCAVQLAIGQCELGEVEVTFNVYVDNWGQETYWEFVPAGNGCGNGTIAFGSNSEEVGCDNGTEISENAGYPDNTMINEGPWCLTEGQSFDLYFVDSYGDGGLVFEVFYDGALSHVFYGSGSGNVWTFQAGVSNLPSYDQPCGAQEVLTDGTPVIVNNADAIAAFGEIHPPNVGCGLYGAWCDGGVSNSVWAWFTVPDGGVYEVSTCNANTTFDTQIAVWTGEDCAELNLFELISSQDDAGCGVGAFYSSTCYVSCLDPTKTYYIQIDGWNGEVGNAEITVTPMEMEQSLEAFLGDVSCPLDKGQTGNGFVQTYLLGSGSNFSAEWTGPDGFSSNANWIFELGPGTYEVTVESACGTIFQDAYTIFQPAGWNVNFDVLQPSCPNSENGEIEVIVSGATAPYEFNWIGPDGFTGVGPFLGDLLPGDYNLFITDERDCEYDQTISLNPEGDFSFDLGPDTTLCLGESYVLSGPVGLSYLWQDGSENQFYNIETADWGIGQHVVILVAETSDGCSYTDPFIFTVEVCDNVEENLLSDIQIFPNPSNGKFQIDNTLGKFATYYITDMAGRRVSTIMNLNRGMNEIDLNLTAGNYLAHLTTNNAEEVIQLSIVK